ncbi:MAG: ABC transporter substrate-binding protein [Candidatus Babeliales bacterium]
MNKLIIALTALSILATGTIYFFVPKNNGVRIAILLPALHPAIDEIERGFKETMAHGKQTYTFDTFNAGGNKTLLKAQAEEIAHLQYDLVFTVGTLCSHTMHTLLQKNKQNLPLVFSAIDNPAIIGVTAESRAQGDQATGVYITDNFDAQLDYLHKVKPTARNILFVYDPTHGSGMEKVRKELERAASAKEIVLTTAEVFATNEIVQKVEPMLSNVDTVLIYTDHTLVSGVDALIKLCNQYGVTLYASDLNSGEKGAALAFGVQEYDHGKEGARKALTILDDYTLARDVAITPISNYKMLINKSTQRAQGLALTDEHLGALAQDANVIIKAAS